jgi:hypothetical protein
MEGAEMSDQEQIFAFSDDIDRLVERYRSEFEMTYAAAVGVLFMKAQLLCSEAEDREEEAK